MQTTGKELDHGGLVKQQEVKHGRGGGGGIIPAAGLRLRDSPPFGGEPPQRLLPLLFP